MLLKKLQLIKEDIYGNMATVYHRCKSLEKLKDILNKTYRNSNHLHFFKYNSSLYTTYDMKSQTNESGNLNDMEGTYGSVVIKFGVKGLRNFLFTSYKEYKKIDPQATPQNYAERQVQRLQGDSWSRDELVYAIKHNMHVQIGQFLEDHSLIGQVKGLQYVGQHDGNCLLVFDYSSLVPLAYTADNGKTWKKDYAGFARDKRIVSDRLDKNEDIKTVKVEYQKDKDGWQVYSATSPAGAWYITRRLLDINAFHKDQKNANDVFEELSSHTKIDNKLYLVRHFADTDKGAGGSYWLFNFKQDDSDIRNSHEVRMYSNLKDMNLQKAADTFPDSVSRAIKAGKYSFLDFKNAKPEKYDPNEAKPGYTNRKTMFDSKAGKPVDEQLLQSPAVKTAMKKYGRVMAADVKGGKLDTEAERRIKNQDKASDFFSKGKREEPEEQGWYQKAFTKHYYFEKRPDIYIKQIWKNGKIVYEASPATKDAGLELSLETIARAAAGKIIGVKKYERVNAQYDKKREAVKKIRDFIAASAKKAFGSDLVEWADCHFNDTGKTDISNRYPIKITVYAPEKKLLEANRETVMRNSRWSHSSTWLIDTIDSKIDKDAALKWLNSVSAEIIHSRWWEK